MSENDANLNALFDKIKNYELTATEKYFYVYADLRPWNFELEVSE